MNRWLFCMGVRKCTLLWPGMIAVNLLLTGCGGRSDLGQVAGRVTLDGAPVENASVEYTPVSEGSLATGRTDANGEFSLMFSRSVAGASLGENIVRISTFDVAYEEGKGEYSIPERIPAKYNRNSELKVKVEPGRNRHNFELEGDGSKVVQPRLPPGV
ncbi:MAG: carboxypeptidase regulatory-like domain-containing protein [Planctomycetales bacterium]|nr:carboxypeptidase regulatory-like domain-containing protein [Planctomycetales bacterium]